ncbi:transmembrane protein 35B-like [Antedon mediterranea]|uniref:transmembrane protein 35B-like n=1 Tax=Antedon mediterranea TaxID=105859 RepID=UPI003AF45ADC
MGFHRALSLALGLLFVASGVPKVVPVQPLHGKMVSDFRSFNKVFPLKQVGVKMEADMYRTVIGAVEIAMGVLVAFGRPDAAWFSTVGLLIIMVGAAYTLISLEKQPMEIAIPMVFGALLFWLLFGDHHRY